MYVCRYAGMLVRWYVCMYACINTCSGYIGQVYLKFNIQYAQLI